jgi:hypothetical protein
MSVETLKFMWIVFRRRYYDLSTLRNHFEQKSPALNNWKKRKEELNIWKPKQITTLASSMARLLITQIPGNGQLRTKRLYPLGSKNSRPYLDSLLIVFSPLD